MNNNIKLFPNKKYVIVHDNYSHDISDDSLFEKTKILMIGKNFTGNIKDIDKMREKRHVCYVDELEKYYKMTINNDEYENIIKMHYKNVMSIVFQMFNTNFDDDFIFVSDLIKDNIKSKIKKMNLLDILPYDPYNPYTKNDAKYYKLINKYIQKNQVYVYKSVLLFAELNNEHNLNNNMIEQYFIKNTNLREYKLTTLSCMSEYMPYIMNCITPYIKINKGATSSIILYNDKYYYAVLIL